MEQLAEHGHDEEEENKTAKGEDNPKEHATSKSPYKETIFIQYSDEEGGHESPKGESQMPEWLEKQLEKKTPTSKDPRARLEAILAWVQISMKKENKPKVRS